MMLIYGCNAVTQISAYFADFYRVAWLFAILAVISGANFALMPSLGPRASPTRRPTTAQSARGRWWAGASRQACPRTSSASGPPVTVPSAAAAGQRYPGVHGDMVV